MQQSPGIPCLKLEVLPDSSGGLSFVIEDRKQEVVLVITGELHLATADSLTDLATRALQPPVQTLILDLGELTFCGAAGVSALVSIQQAATRAGVHLMLTGVQPHVRQVFDIVGMGGLIPMEPSRRSMHRSAPLGSRNSAPAQYSRG